MAAKSHTSSSPRRKERRAQLWTAQQKRKEARRLVGAAAAKKNRELRSQGLETPTQKWEPVKERAEETRRRRSEARKQSQFHQRMGGIGKLDRRTTKLKQAWRVMAAGRPDVFA